MSAGEVAAVVLAVAGAIGVVGLLFALAALVRTLAALRATIEDVRAAGLPLLADLHTAVKQANAELGKVDILLDRAESISGTVDSASKLAYTAFSNPLVKGIALASGGARALRRLRRKAG